MLLPKSYSTAAICFEGTQRMRWRHALKGFKGLPSGGQRMSKASKVVLMLFMGLLFARQAYVQEVAHAPTLEQCRADQRLWLDKLEQTTGPMPEDYRTLNAWSHEMNDCKSVDSENKRLYYNVAGEIQAERVIRLADFLDRHDLYAKFIEEDKA